MYKKKVCALFFSLLVFIFAACVVYAQEASEQVGVPAARSAEVGGVGLEHEDADEGISAEESGADDDVDEEEDDDTSDDDVDEEEGDDTSDDDEEDDDTSDEDEEEGDDNERRIDLGVGEGITPDDFFYFLEDFFLSKFRSDLENREKKVAELRAMVHEGKFDSAREALQRYERYAERAEKNVGPDERDNVRRSAEAIKNVILDVKDEVPEELRNEFLGSIAQREKGIVTAVEIANKVKELCETLATLDPVRYAETCKTEEGAPEWHRELDERLTNEQREEAEGFFGIMSECFEDPRSCPCEKIGIKKFADACSEIAPLAAECEEGNEEACDEMDEMPDPGEFLPSHLQAAMRKIERKYDEKQFEHFMPPECRRAKVTTEKECMEIMFREHAPEECIESFDKGELSFTNERDARKACEEIMFRTHAPEECIEAGVRDPRECGKVMFKMNAPQECIEAGITGEHPSDGKKCEKIMREKGPREGPQGEIHFGRDCKALEDKEEKLQCFEDFYSRAREFRGNGPGEGRGHGGWPPPCEEAQAFSREACEKIMRARGEQDRERMENERRDERQRWEQEFDERRKEIKERHRERRERGGGKCFNDPCADWQPDERFPGGCSIGAPVIEVSCDDPSCNSGDCGGSRREDGREDSDRWQYHDDKERWEKEFEERRKEMEERYRERRDGEHEERPEDRERWEKEFEERRKEMEERGFEGQQPPGPVAFPFPYSEQPGVEYDIPPSGMPPSDSGGEGGSFESRDGATQESGGSMPPSDSSGSFESHDEAPQESGGSAPSGDSSSSSSGGGEITGGIIFIDNEFLKYYYR